MHPNEPQRMSVARQLQGQGVEFGPGCYPLPLGPFVESIRYVDVFDRESFAANFPEVGASVAGFPEIDIRIDFDKELFVERIGKGTCDFVVANHVLEHLVNPIRFLEQVHDLLAEDGLLYLAQPDKRKMFDCQRRRTPLRDVVDRYRANESYVSDERIAEYVQQVERPSEPFGPTSPDYATTVAMHRRRSLHVNVWLLDDVIEILTYLSREMQIHFELHDGILLDDEFVLLLRKTEDRNAASRYATTLTRLWAEQHTRQLDRQHAELMDRLLVLDERVRETQNFIRRLKSWLRYLPGAKWGRRSRPTERNR
jgi:SAM-dependent methyltransferase